MVGIPRAAKGRAGAVDPMAYWRDDMEPTTLHDPPSPAHGKGADDIPDGPGADRAGNGEAALRGPLAQRLQ